MKRKQKTPRRLRPMDVSDDFKNVSSKDISVQASPDVTTKRKKSEAETQTCALNAANVPSVANNSKAPLHGVFRNEPENSDMPQILDVYSLSEAANKQAGITPKQNNSFPVTPPSSPPVFECGPAKGNSVVTQNYRFGKKNPNPCGFSGTAESFGTQTAQIVSGDPRVQYIYLSADQIVDNPQRIANGVLPMNRSTNQAEYRQQGYVETNNNTVDYYHHNYLNNTGKAPIARLRDMFAHSDKYLVPKESHVSKGSTLYTRFRLQPNSKDLENRPPNRRFISSTGVYRQILPRDVPQNIVSQDGPSTSIQNAIQNTYTVDNQNNVNDTGRIPYPPPDAGLLVEDRYKTDASYSSILRAYTRSRVLCDQTQTQTENFQTQTGNSPNSWYQVRPPHISEPAPCGPTSGPTNVSINGIGQNPENALPSSDKTPNFLTPRDVKVQKLKKLLEEQEEALKKLRTNH